MRQDNLSAFDRDWTPPEFSTLLRRATRALMRNLWLLVLSMVAFAALGAFWASSQPQVYTASSAIMIDPRLTSTSSGSPTPTIFQADALIVDSEIEVLTSDRLLRRVLTRLENQQMMPEPQTDEGEDTEAPTTEDWIAWLERQLLVERVGNTFVISVSFTATDPQLAATIANLVSDEYLVSQQADTRGRVEDATRFLTTEIDRLAKQSSRAEAAVQQFLVEHDVPRDGTLGLVGLEITSIEEEIVRVQSDMRESRTRLDQIDVDLQRLESGNGVGELLSVDSGTPTLARLFEQLKNEQAQGQVLRGDGVGSAQVVVDRLTDQLREELQQLRSARQSEIEVASASLAALEEQHDQLQQDASRIAAEQIELGNLQRTAESIESQQRRMLDQLQQSQSQDLFIVGAARIIDDAVAPSEPSNLSLFRSTVVAAIAGLFLAVAIAFFREQADDRIRTPEDVRDSLRTAYLGSLPNQRIKPSSSPAKKAAKQTAGRQMSVDTLRRTAVSLSGQGPTLISSPDDQRSRADFSYLLGRFLADHGANVLLIDGDARSRMLTRLLDLSPQSHQPVTLSEGLSIVAAPPDAALNPSAHSQAIRDIVGQTAADYVLIDGPALTDPVEELIQAADISRVLLTLPFGQQSRSNLSQLLEQRPMVTDRLAGAIMTDASARRLRRFDPITRHTHKTS